MNQSNDYMINILEALKTFNDTYIIEQKLALTINLSVDLLTHGAEQVHAPHFNAQLESGSIPHVDYHATVTFTIRKMSHSVAEFVQDGLLEAIRYGYSWAKHTLPGEVEQEIRQLIQNQDRKSVV